MCFWQHISFTTALNPQCPCGEYHTLEDPNSTILVQSTWALLNVQYLKDTTASCQEIYTLCKEVQIVS